MRIIFIELAMQCSQFKPLRLGSRRGTIFLNNMEVRKGGFTRYENLSSL